MDGSCQPCQPGYYNDAADDSQCQECATGKDTVHLNSTACGKLIHEFWISCMYYVICLYDITIIIYSDFSLILPKAGRVMLLLCEDVVEGILIFLDEDIFVSKGSCM